MQNRSESRYRDILLMKQHHFWITNHEFWRWSNFCTLIEVYLVDERAKEGYYSVRDAKSIVFPTRRDTECDDCTWWSDQGRLRSTRIQWLRGTFFGTVGISNRSIYSDPMSLSLVLTRDNRARDVPEAEENRPIAADHLTDRASVNLNIGT